MQELERMISIYHIAFIIFLVLTIVFLIVSVILFFRFNIRGIFDMRSGRGARRTIQKMQELNDQTGKLRQDIVTNTPVSLSPSQRISAPPTEKRISNSFGQAVPNGQMPPGAQMASPGNVHTEGYAASDGSTETVLLADQGATETVLLADQGATETTLLYDYNETTVLSQKLIEDNPQPEEKKLPGAFKIEKEIMWIHTGEIL